MKKFFLILALLSITFASRAQLYIGGNAAFWRNSDFDTTTFSVLPEVGCNLNDKWGVGATFGYIYYDEDGSVMNAIEFSPYARYTVVKSGVFKGFVDGGFDMLWISDRVDDHSTTAWGLGLKPGIAIQVSQHCSLVAHLGFLGYRNGSEYEIPGFQDGFGFDFSGQNLSIGFYYCF